MLFFINRGFLPKDFGKIQQKQIVLEVLYAHLIKASQPQGMRFRCKIYSNVGGQYVYCVLTSKKIVVDHKMLKFGAHIPSVNFSYFINKRFMFNKK